MGLLEEDKFRLDLEARYGYRPPIKHMWQCCETEGCDKPAKGKLCDNCRRQVYSFITKVFYPELKGS